MPIHYDTIEDGQNKKPHLLFSKSNCDFSQRLHMTLSRLLAEKNDISASSTSASSASSASSRLHPSLQVVANVLCFAVLVLIGQMSYLGCPTAPF